MTASQLWVEKKWENLEFSQNVSEMIFIRWSVQINLRFEDGVKRINTDGELKKKSWFKSAKSVP